MRPIQTNIQKNFTFVIVFFIYIYIFNGLLHNIIGSSCFAWFWVYLKWLCACIGVMSGFLGVNNSDISWFIFVLWLKPLVCLYSFVFKCQSSACAKFVSIDFTMIYLHNAFAHRRMLGFSIIQINLYFRFIGFYIMCLKYGGV